MENKGIVNVRRSAGAIVFFFRFIQHRNDVWSTGKKAYKGLTGPVPNACQTSRLKEQHYIVLRKQA